MPVCVILSCPHHEKRSVKLENIRFHRLPNDPVISRLWLQWIHAKNHFDIQTVPAGTVYVCSDHFRDEDKGNRKLKAGAVPCIIVQHTPAVHPNHDKELNSVPATELNHVSVSTKQTHGSEDSRNVWFRGGEGSVSKLKVCRTEKTYQSPIRVPADEVINGFDESAQEVLYVPWTSGSGMETDEAKNQPHNVQNIRNVSNVCVEQIFCEPDAVQNVGTYDVVEDEQANDIDENQDQSQQHLHSTPTLLDSNGRGNSNKKTKRICSAYQCDNLLQEHFYAFPKIAQGNQTDEDGLSRCKRWIQNAGNAGLLAKPSSNLYRQNWLCSVHFDESQFVNKTKLRLKPDAVPSIFKQLPLPDETMAVYPVLSRQDVHREMFQDDSTDQTTADLDTFQKRFQDEMLSFEWRVCNNCKAKFMCKRHSQKKCFYTVQTCRKFAELDLDEVVPQVLTDLSFIEEQLIAMVHPIVSVVKLKGHQLGYSGNVINFPQDVNSFATQLPHRLKDLPSVLTIRVSTNLKPVDFQVRAQKVRDALIWLKENNVYYKDVDISEHNLNLLPEDDNVFELVQGFNIDEEQHPGLSGQSNPVVDTATSGQDTYENLMQEQEDVYESGSPIMVKAAGSDQIESILSWPTIGSQPINEFQHESYIVQAFPCLFPSGKGNLRLGRKKSVTALNYFRHLLRYSDDRFAQHNRFRYFALNSYMRWCALQNGTLFVKTQPQLQHMTLDDLKEELERNPAIIKKIMYRNSSISGTKAYWFARGKELLSMVDQIGLPTLFFTLSAADLHWPELFKMLSPNENLDTMSDFRRRHLVKMNPLVVDQFFLRRAEEFINEVLVKKFKVKDFWYRVEYQHRGSPHIHGVLWLENAPDVENILQKSDEEQQAVSKYFSELVTAFHPNQDQPPSAVHPCRKFLSEIQDLDQDLAELLNKVQRHTICSEQYCIRKCKTSHMKKCRFKFPQEEQKEAKLQLDDKGNVEFVPQRNDERLNKYNAYLTQTWRANTDVAPVVSKQALINYLAKYISKSEHRSDHLAELMTIVNAVTDKNKSVKHAIQKLYIKACSERDFSAQETCHLLMGEKLHSSGGRDFVNICFNENMEWRLLRNDDTARSLIEKYQTRSDWLDGKCLWHVAKHFKMPQETKRKKDAIVQIFPKFNPNLNSTCMEKYYRQQVLLYVPWKDENVLKGEKSWAQVYNDYIEIIRLNAETNNLLQGMQPDEDNFEEPPQNHILRPEEWQIISGMGPSGNVEKPVLGNREIDRYYNWHDNIHLYEKYGGIPELLTWLNKTKKANSTAHVFNIAANNIALSSEQQKIIDLVQLQIQQIQDPTKNMMATPTPQTALIQGKAGTGKSLVIARIAELILNVFGEGSVLLLGPTGVSALNIGGSTIHSKLIIKPSDEFASLNDVPLYKFKEMMQKVKFIIIDEFSMVGCEMLYMIDQRLRQGKDNPSEPYGGLNVYMFGDINQLPPVFDTPPYSDSHTRMEVIAGKVLYDNIDTIFILENIHRQKDQAFQQILNNISSGQVTLQDYEVLQTRFESEVLKASRQEAQSFKDAPHFFATNQEKEDHNTAILSAMKDPETKSLVPVARIPAKYKAATENDKVPSKGDDDDVLNICKGAKIMLRQNLWTEKGLVNGSTGEVVDIIYHQDAIPQDDPPSVLICKFETYTGPYLDERLKTIPIVPVQKTVTDDNSNNSYIITQFPVVLNYGCTIHKSQGLTVDKAYVDLGPKERQAGLTYVALSRVKSMEGLMLKPFPYSRIANLNRSRAIQKRQQWLYHLQHSDEHAKVR